MYTFNFGFNRDLFLFSKFFINSFTRCCMKTNFVLFFLDKCNFVILEVNVRLGLLTTTCVFWTVMIDSTFLLFPAFDNFFASSLWRNSLMLFCNLINPINLITLLVIRFGTPYFFILGLLSLQIVFVSD